MKLAEQNGTTKLSNKIICLFAKVFIRLFATNPRTQTESGKYVNYTKVLND
jgi:hypothetical protein